jgi:hypothetical protein
VTETAPEVALMGLDGTNPLGLLAALGALVELDHAGCEPTLRWTDDLAPHAVVTGAASLDELVSILDQGRRRWLESTVLAWPAGEPITEVKPGPDVLRTWAWHVQDRVADDRAASDLWSALMAEGALDNSGKAKPTHLHFAAGQQRFLGMARQLAAELDPDRLHEALTGPWRYDSSLPSFSWDARGERIYALRASNPAKEKRLGVPGADWLAFLGISCYPVANRNGRLETTACSRPWKRSAFRWPLWRVPIGLWTARSLLADPDLVGAEKQRSLHPERLAARGVLRVLEAPIRRTDQGGYGSFGAPTVLAEAPWTSV